MSTIPNEVSTIPKSNTTYIPASDWSLTSGGEGVGEEMFSPLCSESDRAGGSGIVENVVERVGRMQTAAEPATIPVPLSATSESTTTHIQNMRADMESIIFGMCVYVVYLTFGTR